MSGIEDDLRLPYYTEVERFTNMPKYESGLGGSHSYKWVPARARELANSNEILVRDRVLGSSNGAHHCQWNAGGCCYSHEITKTMLLARFGLLKRSMKLCHNTSESKKE